MAANHSGYYFRLIEKYKGSNKTIKEFCEQHSLNTKTFYYWKKKYQGQAKEGFTSLSIIGSASPVDKPEKEKAITIQYADGTQLKIEGVVNAVLIKELLPAFSK